MSNGVILERLSGKKLSILVAILFLLQISFFLIGGFFFPNSTHTETIEGILCKDIHKSSNIFYYTRDKYGKQNGNCIRIANDYGVPVNGVSQQDIVFSFQLPLPRDGQSLTLHRSFQTMMCVLSLQVNFKNEKHLTYFNKKFNQTNSKESSMKIAHKIPLNVRLAYRNRIDTDDNWHLLAENKHIEKRFLCNIDDYTNSSLDCDLVQIFELGSVHHEYYLINLNFFDSAQGNNNKKYSSVVLPDIHVSLTFIYQTGGFTIMWFIMKTFFLPFLLIIMIWYWNRIVQLDRKSNLIERMLFSVGLSATLLNLPIEWLTLYIDLKWMLFYSDIRQGIFYLALFTFWIIFCGEHYIDENTSCGPKTFKSYWLYVGAVWFSSICLLIFELCERGMQLSDPFFSIWDSETGANVVTVALILASASGVSYFGLILYLVIKIFIQFKSKQSQLPHMNKLRRLFYEGIIYRFKFLLISTLICVAMTISCSILNNFRHNQWNFDHNETVSFNFNSAFMTGVYAMWNIYVSALMIFYAPSHKNKQENVTSESIEFVNMETTYSTKDKSVLTTLATKIASG